MFPKLGKKWFAICQKIDGILVARHDAVYNGVFAQSDRY
jgi:hypothetical protein